MLSNGLLFLMTTMVVNELGAKNVPAKLTELFDAGSDCCSNQQERFKRTANSSTFNETARNKRQIHCCYGNQCPIITLPSCSIPYTIINGTCYLATCPKPCNPGCTVPICCTEQVSHKPNGTDNEATCNQEKEQQQTSSSIDSPVHINGSRPNSTSNNETVCYNNTTNNVTTQGTPSTNITSSTTKPGNGTLIKHELNSTSTSTVEETFNSTAHTDDDPLKSATSSIVHSVGMPPEKIANASICNPCCCCVCNKSVCNVSDMWPSKGRSGDIESSDDYDPDLGSFGCNYSPTSGCRCSIMCNNELAGPMVETAGLLKGSGNGEGGNSIISSMNILAGPSCADPCCNQNACMLSHSGNGEGGNKIISNANYINGGNMLCCSGNGKGGNCIRSVINIIGGNSGNVLSSCDGEFLKQLCDFITVDNSYLLGSSRNDTGDRQNNTDSKHNDKIEINNNPPNESISTGSSSDSLSEAPPRNELPQENYHERSVSDSSQGGFPGANLVSSVQDDALPTPKKASEEPLVDPNESLKKGNAECGLSHTLDSVMMGTKSKAKPLLSSYLLPHLLPPTIPCNRYLVNRSNYCRYCPSQNYIVVPNYNCC